MRSKRWKGTALAVVCLLVLALPVLAVDFTQVAGASDRTTVETVGVEGMTPIGPAEVMDGVYDVEVECSSSMFKVTKAVLTVEGGEMTADLTLSGTSYFVLYPGTAVEAAGDTEDHYIGYTEDADGAYVYTVPVPALDEPFSCAAFSKNKGKWYDRTLLIRADSLPEGAVRVELPDYEALEKAARDARIEAMKGGTGEEPEPPVPMDLPDGTYEAAVTLTGGSGKASVTSPAQLTVKDGAATARIEWSSPHYDYMIVNHQRYLPVNTEGNSVFEIPVAVLNQPIPVIADTTAMSEPHEIKYTLTFDPDSAPVTTSTVNLNGLLPLGVSALAMVVLGCVYGRKERHL